MNVSKNFLTVRELQEICEKMNLSTDGVKHELIERLVNSARNVSSESNSQSSSSSIMPELTLQKMDQATQTADESTTKILNDKFWFQNIRNGAFLKVFFAIAFSVGCYALFHLFIKIEKKIEITVKRPWFE